MQEVSCHSGVQMTYMRGSIHIENWGGNVVGLVFTGTIRPQVSQQESLILTQGPTGKQSDCCLKVSEHGEMGTHPVPPFQK